MLELYAVKVARTVLRRGEDCEIFFLSDEIKQITQIVTELYTAASNLNSNLAQFKS